MLINDAGRRTRRIRAASIVAAVVALLIGLQTTAVVVGFVGPLHSLLGDYLATPDSATLPWAGLGLAMVGLSGRRRTVALGWAAGLDAVFALERLARTGALTVGNGPMIVLTGLAVVAGVRWSGDERRDALRAAGWGALLIVASKAADTWLRITALGRPTVWDEYAMMADHALGQPSWLLGRALQAAGPAASGVLHWIYIELPVAAMIVAVYQLRNVATGGWPAHHVMRTFVVLGLIGPLIYLLFPVVGPIFAYGVDGGDFAIADYWPHIWPPADVTPGAVVFDDATARNCMPSMHLGWALVVFIHARTGPGWMRWGGVIWLVGTVIATLGFGYHYGVDLIAGAVLCLTVEAVLRVAPRGRRAARSWLVAGGAAVVLSLLVSCRYCAVWLARAPVVSGPLLVGVLVAFAAAFAATFRGWSDRSAVSRDAGRPRPARGRWGPYPCALPGRSRHG